MKRLLTLLALAGLSAAAGACGDDSGDDGDDKGEPKNDASVKDSAVPVRPKQIDNLAAKCTADTDCQGVGSVECLKDLGGMTELPGGYCTAQCNYSSECGDKGACPVAEIIASPTIAAALQAFGGPAALQGILPQNCIETCTVGDAGGRGTCSQPDHNCGNLTDALAAGGGAGGALGGLSGLLGNIAALKLSYCFPEIDLGDAGLPRRDGGAALIVNGLDAGL
jgi:hypothetical protein